MGKMTSTKINAETYDKLLSIKQIDEYKSISAVIEDLILRVPQKDDSIKEAPAWKWIVGFIGQDNPDEILQISWEELKESEIGQIWKLEGSWDSYEATILYKDTKGAFVRFGEQRYDDPEMIFYTDYFHFI
jgi:predicted CopG family antitoxin